MKIIVSNDDGVNAKGLAALTKALSENNEVKTIAPDRNRSGASNSLTLENPLRVRQLDNGYYSVQGTPTDCVHLALTGFFDELPDIVVSGINAGANLGDDVLYSGTVAAATEGRFLGYPSIAISLAGDRFKHYDTAATVAKLLLEHLKSHRISGKLLNVNVPDIPYEELDGVEVTRLGTRHSAEPTVKTLDPRGRTIYWVGPAGAQQDAGPGTDFHAINNNRVSITPLHFDWTHYKDLGQMKGWIEDFCLEEA